MKVVVSYQKKCIHGYAAHIRFVFFYFSVSSYSKKKMNEEMKATKTSIDSLLLTAIIMESRLSEKNHTT